MLLLVFYSPRSRHTHAHTPQPHGQSVRAVNRAARVQPPLSLLSSAAKLRRWCQQVGGEGMESQGLVYRRNPSGRVQLFLAAALPQEPQQHTQLHRWNWPVATSIPARSLPSLIFPAARPQTWMVLPQVPLQTLLGPHRWPWGWPVG